MLSKRTDSGFMREKKCHKSYMRRSEGEQNKMEMRTKYMRKCNQSSAWSVSTLITHGTFFVYSIGCCKTCLENSIRNNKHFYKSSELVAVQRSVWIRFACPLSISSFFPFHSFHIILLILFSFRVDPSCHTTYSSSFSWLEIFNCINERENLITPHFIWSVANIHLTSPHTYISSFVTWILFFGILFPRATRWILDITMSRMVQI